MNLGGGVEIQSITLPDPMVCIYVWMCLLFVSALDCQPHEDGLTALSLVFRTWNREGPQSIFF